MDIKNDFLSVVCLGNFNPAILDSKFLVDNNIFKEGSRPISQDKTPIFTKIGYKDFEFMLELNRFQIVERNLLDFLNNRCLKIMEDYLKLLKYTPISIYGINLNSYVFPNDINKVIQNIDDKYLIYKILNIEEFTLEKVVKNHCDKTDFLRCNIIFENIKKDSLIRINIKKNGGNFIINYNFELKRINSIEELKIISESFSEINSNYINIIKKLFGD